MKRLGATQAAFLKAMLEKGDWYNHRFCGWTWGTSSETLRLARSLLKHGLVREYLFESPYQEYFTVTNKTTARRAISEAKTR